MTTRTIEQLDSDIAQLKADIEKLRGPHVQVIESSISPTGDLLEGPHTELVTISTPSMGQTFTEWMAAISGMPSLVSDPGIAREGPCIRFELGDGMPPLVFQNGVNGALTPEQQALYCAQGYADQPIDDAARLRLRSFREVALQCGGPETGSTPDSVSEYFTCLGNELFAKGL